MAYLAAVLRSKGTQGELFVYLLPVFTRFPSPSDTPGFSRYDFILGISMLITSDAYTLSLYQAGSNTFEKFFNYGGKVRTMCSGVLVRYDLTKRSPGN